MTKIFERCRVSFVERPFNMPFARVSDVRVDLVLLDCASSSRRELLAI